MTSSIEQELKARGVADVLVYLRPGPLAIRSASANSAKSRLDAEAAQASSLAPTGARLTKHFITSERSLRSQVREASAARKHKGRGGDRLRLAKPKTRPDVRRVTSAGMATPSYGKAEARVLLFPNLGIMLGTVDAAGAAALQADPAVKAVTGTPPLSLIRPERRAAATLKQSVTWGVKAINAPALWKKGITGKGVLVGHLDTGIDGAHKVFKGAIASFAEFDALGRQITPPPSPYDSEDHGTHTAGTIAGRPAGKRHVGVAPGAELASAVVIEGGDVVARVLGGMDWAVGQGIKVLNMSLGFRGWWEDFLPLTQLLRDRGVLPVFAVGNEGPGTSRSPGNYDEALSVGAHDAGNAVAWFSSSQSLQQHGPVPDMVAPGVAVISAMPGAGSRYQEMDGSSMATPHVSGLAALLFEAVPQATVDQVEQAILASCSLRGMSSFRAGKGTPDALKALQSLVNAG
jgi:subtilisin